MKDSNYLYVVGSVCSLFSLVFCKFNQIKIVYSPGKNNYCDSPPGEREGGGRLSMWGEQLHDKLFAKKDMKEVMRNKLKLNLKDENNDGPQNFHTNIQ